MHADVARRALALIADGLVDRAGVPGLARRLGYSERQLHRILVAELGAGAIALARAQRAQSARLLIDSADLTLGEIALAAGFGSVRQFNDTMRRIYGTTPAALRTGPRPATGIRLRLPAKAPFDGAAVVRFLARHEVPGLEHVQRGAYTRAVALENGGGLVTLTPKRDALICELKLDDLRDLSAAVARCRRLFDLDADPQAIHTHLARLPVVGDLVRRAPGIRIAGAVDGFELAVRTIIRRENEYEFARTSTARLVRRYGAPLQDPTPTVTHRFPTPSALAEADPATFGVDARRAHAIRDLARQGLYLDAGSAVDDEVRALLAIPGIGPWIANYIAMRALGDPDAYLEDCDRLARALSRAGGTAEPETWRPYSSYAIAALWRSLDDSDTFALAA
ncbi:helix-turn-helix domain-containing protein [Solirubrobacter ginsenosidimutans]|uniref:DNA-3-methyladenine glycosylase II n=1 Tax=Solirubrobacter ginsenosidimutans TaxID=490573 RepID=A0A9X3MVD3_9ACTN|nr:AlkA N-terminal domain-containing protein [Solirubrobacter ginsenosidimutans]MDA0162521.1 helix-turn-helix domain-containing protein [Solirubrobacter ginsenosidimutans]